jgi:prevent-host-death family protein
MEGHAGTAGLNRPSPGALDHAGRQGFSPGPAPAAASAPAVASSGGIVDTDRTYSHILSPAPAAAHRDRSEMREVIGLGQLRNNACTYLERVAGGQTIDVVRRGKLVARIVPVGDGRVAPIPARSVTAAAPDAGWVGLEELRKRAGRCFDRVAAGETVYVVRGGRLLARIVSAGCATAAPVPADAGQPIELGELRKRAGRYFDRVAAGQPVEVTRGGRVVARIVSAAGDDTAGSQTTGATFPQHEKLAATT